MNELMIGAAGEHLVCSNLLMQGVLVSLAAAGSRYDIIADDGNGRLVRVQVKSTFSEPRKIGHRDGVLRFTLTQGRRKKGRASDSAEVIAFAFLRQNIVAYLRASQASSTAVEWRLVPLVVDSRGRRNPRGTKLIASEFGVFPW
jgi:hypothetical protein